MSLNRLNPLGPDTAMVLTRACKDKHTIENRDIPPGKPGSPYEHVRFADIMWAQPYSYGTMYGTLILLPHATLGGEFRFYTQAYTSIQEKTCQHVTHLMRRGLKIPDFPWCLELYKGKKPL